MHVAVGLGWWIPKKKQSDVYVIKWTVPRMAIMRTPLCGRSAVDAVINHTGHQYKVYAIATIWGFFGGEEQGQSCVSKLLGKKTKLAMRQHINEN